MSNKQDSLTKCDPNPLSSSISSNERQLEGLSMQDGTLQSQSQHPQQPQTMVPPVQLAASSATSSLFSGVAPTTQLISFSCESPRQSMAARKPSIPRVGSHNDIVQGTSSQNNRDSIMMDEEEMKEPSRRRSRKGFEMSSFGQLAQTGSTQRHLRPGGIKGVQSLNNLTAYAQDSELTRVVAERTVFYCSNFDLDAAEWFRQYTNIKTFSSNLHNKLDESWHEYIKEALLRQPEASHTASFWAEASIDAQMENAGENPRLKLSDVSDNRNNQDYLNFEEAATSPQFKSMLDFYILRNFDEAPGVPTQSKDQKFNSFLRDIQAYFECKLKYRVQKVQLFRQVVYSFYEEAEFCRQELQKAERSTQIRLTKQALREFSQSNATPTKTIQFPDINDLQGQKAEQGSPINVVQGTSAKNNIQENSSEPLTALETEYQNPITRSQIPQQFPVPEKSINESAQFQTTAGVAQSAPEQETLNQDQSRFVRSYKSWSSYLPGISIIRNHVINPLLVATEKVVEQYMPVVEERQDSQLTLGGVEASSSTRQSQYENSLKMLNNLRTTPTDPDASDSASQFGEPPLEMRHRMQNLTLNDLRSEDMSVSSKGIQGGAQPGKRQNKLKKRRFKEIDNAWDINMDAKEQSLIAVKQQQALSDETLSMSSRKGANRRCIKLNFKKINRICAEMDIARGRCSATGQSGIREQAKIMGSFAILMYDLHTDHLHQMKDHDQAVIREQIISGDPKKNKKRSSECSFGGGGGQSQNRTTSSSFEHVDSVRFLKTNVRFYERAILIWIKFKMLNESRLEATAKTSQFQLLQEFNQFLSGFLKKTESEWSRQKSEANLLDQAIELIASIILTQHFQSVQQFQSDFRLDSMKAQDREDAFMSLFFANVYQCVLGKWENFVVEQSAKFRQKHSSTGQKGQGQPPRNL